MKFRQASDIKVGVIGYGGAFNMGKAHLDEMKRAGMTPFAVAEIDPARLAVARTDFPDIQTYASPGEMLKKSDVNLVAIITPHNTHAPLALEALRARRHVVCEKPMAITTAECDAVIAAAAQSKVMISTYHNRHWDGCILEAMRQIRAGEIGEVYRIEAHMGGYGKPGDWWRTSKSISGGVMYDWGVHLLEYALQVMGDTAMTEVTGFAKTGLWAPQTAWPNDCNEDEGRAVVRFANGAWLTLTLTQLDSNPKRGILEITGTKGSYVMDHANYEVIRHVDGKVVSTKGRNPPSEGWRYYQNVADYLVKREPLVITGEFARRSIHILDLAGQSARKGASLKTKYP